MKHTLIVVGSGIKFLSHLTIEAKTSIQKSDKVLYLVNEPAMKHWIKNNSVHNESLDNLYHNDNNRKENYLKIAEYVNQTLNHTRVLCLVMYGHPTFLADPSLYALQLAIKSGHDTYVLPGISSQDCLFADLKIDPIAYGCQSFEATDFLIHEREIDTSCHLVLFQSGMIGVQENYNSRQNPKKGLEILKEYLLKKYATDHMIILYEAAQYPLIKSTIKEIQLRDLSEFKISPLTTLYIPPNIIKKRNEKYVSILREIYE